MASSAFLFLYGPSGAGKSTLARRLSAALSLPAYDLDARIQQRTGQSPAEIFAARGEAAFRAEERAELRAVLNEAPGVVALGGGALLDESNRALAEAHGRVLRLTAGADTLAARLAGSAELRPLAADPQRLQAMLAARAAHYASFTHALDTSALSEDAALDAAQIGLGAWRVSAMGSPYSVRVQPGGLDSIGARLRENDLNGPLALVSDEHLDDLYAARVLASLEQAGYRAARIRIPAGEENKTLTTLAAIWAGLVEAGLERGSTVLALGGGVTGDLSGFAASAFLRGVRWVGLPTSLLAMADSSLGGKTGADLPQGKNLIGAFYPPALVLADPRVLDSLPEAEIRSGLAEVVKHGIISDPQLFALCAQGLDALRADWDTLVRRTMAVKIRVIELDPYERGPREALNAGHTIGHGVEKASRYRLRHGEAVAIGLVAEARLAERLKLASGGLAEEIATVLETLGLPTRIPRELSNAEILRAMRVDKKRAGGQVRFSLPVRIGAVENGVTMPLDETLLEELR